MHSTGPNFQEHNEFLWQFIILDFTSWDLEPLRYRRGKLLSSEVIKKHPLEQWAYTEHNPIIHLPACSNRYQILVESSASKTPFSLLLHEQVGRSGAHNTE